MPSVGDPTLSFLHGMIQKCGMFRANPLGSGTTLHLTRPIPGHDIPTFEHIVLDAVGGGILWHDEYEDQHADHDC